MRHSTSAVAAIALLWAAILSSAAGCGRGGPCSAAEVAAALAEASPGDTVRLGVCDVEGPITVPAGITLTGAGEDRTRVVGEGSGALVTLLPGEAETALTGLTVVSRHRAGIVASGEGRFRVDDVTVEAHRGLALGVEEARRLLLNNVSLQGPVGTENVDEISMLPRPDVLDATGTHGLVLVRVEDATLVNVTSSGFAYFGALFAESEVAWNGGGASDNLRTGLMIWDGSASLSGLEFCRTLLGLQLWSAGTVFAGGASIISTRLNVCDGGGYGMLHDDVAAEHVDPRVEGNRHVGVWVQNGERRFSLTGALAEIAGNTFAGMVFLEAGDIVLRDAHIHGTRMGSRVLVDAGRLEVGDGLQVIGPESMDVLDLRIEDNARAGLLIDLEDGIFDAGWLSNVQVEAFGEQLGAVAQNGELPEGWDAGVSRNATAATNDAAFQSVGDPLDTVGVIGPESLEPPDQLLTSGLAALLDG
jgi:hypothetical protein